MLPKHWWYLTSRQERSYPVPPLTKIAGLRYPKRIPIITRPAMIPFMNDNEPMLSKIREPDRAATNSDNFCRGWGTPSD